MYKQFVWRLSYGLSVPEFESRQQQEIDVQTYSRAHPASYSMGKVKGKGVPQQAEVAEEVLVG